MYVCMNHNNQKYWTTKTVIVMHNMYTVDSNLCSHHNEDQEMPLSYKTISFFFELWTTPLERTFCVNWATKLLA